MKDLVQRRRFYGLSKRFNQVYVQLNKLGKQPFLMPFWEDVNKKTIAEFSPAPDFGFLAIRSLKDTMFVQPSQEWSDAQLQYLRKKIGRHLNSLAREDAVGRPELFKQDGLSTSHNTIHHLYHIYRFLDETDTKLSDIKSIVEWGGGYGSMAKLWKRLDASATYTIIDTTLFCAIQWLYLSCVLGTRNVNLLSSKSDKIVMGKINILPLGLLEKAPKTCDLFVSTWGLSESKAEAQDYVVAAKWFGAKHLLIGFQDSIKVLAHASRLGKLAAKDKAKIIDIEFIPGNHYAFK